MTVDGCLMQWMYHNDKSDWLCMEIAYVCYNPNEPRTYLQGIELAKTLTAEVMCTYGLTFKIL